MNKQKMYCFTKQMRVMQKNNKVIASNRFTGKWVKISLESYRFLQEFIQNNCTFNDLCNQHIPSDELSFMEKLLDVFIDLKLIKPVNSELTYIRNISISLSVTHRCNLNCHHCSYSAVGPMDKTEEMNTEQVISTLDNIINCNPHNIVITGGEPLIREDFVEFSDYLGEHYKGEKALMTNATLIGSKNIDCIIRNYTSLDISMDGVDEATCATIRGKGVYASVIKAIRELQRNGMKKISLSMVLTGNNVHLKDRFLDLCAELQVKALPREFIAIGRGKENFDYLNRDEKREHRIVSYAIENVEMLDLRACCCAAGVGEIFIEPNGDIYPCPLLIEKKFFIGNVFTDTIDLKSYFENEDYFETESYKELDLLDASNHERCKDCSVNQFCITCPADLNAYQNEELYWSRFCNYHKAPFEKVVWGEET